MHSKARDRRDPEGRREGACRWHCHRQSSIQKEIETRPRSPATQRRFTEEDLEIIKQPLEVSEAAILRRLMESMNSSLVGKWMAFMDEQKKNAKVTSDIGAQYSVEEPVLISRKCSRLAGLELKKFKDGKYVEAYVTSIHLRGKKPSYTVFVVEGSHVVRVKEKHVAPDLFSRRTPRR